MIDSGENPMIRCLKIRRVSSLFHVRAIEFEMMKFNFILSARVLYLSILYTYKPFSPHHSRTWCCASKICRSTVHGEVFAVLEILIIPELPCEALTLQCNNKRRATNGSGYFGSVLKRLTSWLGGCIFCVY